MSETFKDWLRKQVRAEGPDDDYMTDEEVDTVINAYTNVELIQRFAWYQTTEYN